MAQIDQQSRPDGVAANKVFSIPELLEMILIRLPHSKPSLQHPGPPSQPLQLPGSTIMTGASFPSNQVAAQYSAALSAAMRRSFQLFSLQRVNKTFQATITGSKTIRRAMFLELSSASWTEPVKVGLMFGHGLTRSSRVSFMLEDLFHLKVWPCCVPTPVLRADLDYGWIRENVRLGISADELFAEQANEAYGSWREIKVGAVGKSIPFNLAMHGYLWPYSGLFSEDATLGELVDMFKKPLKQAWMDGSQHKALAGLEPKCD